MISYQRFTVTSTLREKNGNQHNLFQRRTIKDTYKHKPYKAVEPKIFLRHLTGEN